MNQIIKPLTVVFFISIFLSFGCDDQVKKGSIGYDFKPTSTSVSWTAFKTTDKLPVKGKFTNILIERTKPASSDLLKSLEGIKIKIDPISVFTFDPVRDKTLWDSFFSLLVEPNHVEGFVTNISSKNDFSGRLIINLKFNGSIRYLPAEYSISGNRVIINASLDLLKWDGQNALNSLNEACLDLHKGPDGISKTWETIELEIVSYGMLETH